MSAGIEVDCQVPEVRFPSWHTADERQAIADGVGRLIESRGRLGAMGYAESVAAEVRRVMQADGLDEGHMHMFLGCTRARAVGLWNGWKPCKLDELATVAGSERADEGCPPDGHPRRGPRGCADGHAGEGRRKVEHLYWIADGDAARAMGLGEVLSVCRRAWMPLDSPLPVTASLLSDGSVVTDNAPDACRVCDSMYKASARRELSGGRQRAGSTRRPCRLTLPGGSDRPVWAPGASVACWGASGCMPWHC